MRVDHGLDRSDPFVAGALYLAEAVGERFACSAQVHELFDELLALEIPRLPSEPVEAVLVPIDRLLDQMEPEPALVELTGAVVRLACDIPPRSDQAERLHRSAMWAVMRLDPTSATTEVLELLRRSTPDSRPQAGEWPDACFFSCLLVLVYLGGAAARRELSELLAAARDLGYHDLAPVLDWYLDHSHTAPAR